MKLCIDTKEPPTVFCDEQADDECYRQGWKVTEDKKSNTFTVLDKIGKQLGCGATKLLAVNKAMRDTSGKFYIPPWERRKEWQHMQK